MADQFSAGLFIYVYNIYFATILFFVFKLDFLGLYPGIVCAIFIAMLVVSYAILLKIIIK